MSEQPAQYKTGLSTDQDYDMVNHPAHYNNRGGIECIDYIQWFTLNAGTAVKYLWRAGDKPGADKVQDLKKAIFYIDAEISRIDQYWPAIVNQSYPDSAPDPKSVFALFDGNLKNAVIKFRYAAFTLAPHKRLIIGALESAKEFIQSEINIAIGST